jgi:purine-cytosine permease-like protein
VAWIASGILYAAASSDAPGVVAYEAIGLAGAICVVIAGWTTANPTLYRAGMALQVASGWSRWKVTLLAGIITTLAALFPALVMKLLDFVAIYGLLLVPMGAVILADFYLIPKIGLQPFYAEKKKIDFNTAAAATWFVMLLLAISMRIFLKVEVFFLPAPIWVLSLGAYLLFSKMYQKELNPVTR